MNTYCRIGQMFCEISENLTICFIHGVRKGVDLLSNKGYSEFLIRFMCILKYRVVSRLVAIQVNLCNQKRLVFYEKGSLQGWLGIKVKSISRYPLCCLSYIGF